MTVASPCRVVSTPILLALAVLVAAGSAWYVAHLELVQFVTDDGGITLRYAERIAHGRGFNYNDGERVNGASCTLYTLILGGLLRAGLSPAMAISGFAIVCFGVTVAVLIATFARYWSIFAAVFALAMIFASQVLFNYVFDALEPTLAMLLAALLFHALHTRSRVYQGVVLGLLVASKLDGALAAIAFTLASLVVARAPVVGTSPSMRSAFLDIGKVALVAFATVLPFLVLLLVCFGTIVPQSALTKVFPVDVPPRSVFDPLWISRDLAAVLPLCFAPALLSFLIRGDADQRFVRLSIGLWCVLHVLVYSIVDLGAPYPWYESLPAFLIVILATITAHTLLHPTNGVAGNTVEESTRARGLRRVSTIAACVLLTTYFGVHEWPRITARLRHADRPERMNSASARELARLATGAWLRKNTSGRELLVTGEGLPAFEYKGPVYDIGLLNSRRDPTALSRASYLVQGPYGVYGLPPWKAEPDLSLVATFQFGADADLFAVYARDDSEIARASRCHVRVSLLSAQPIDTATNEPIAAGRIVIKNRDLFARVPSSLVLTVRAPCPPLFSVSPQVQSRRGGHESVRLRIRINGEEVFANVLAAGTPATPHAFQAKTSGEEGQYRLELSASSVEGDVQGVWAQWGALEASAGDALSPSDFTLMCAPWARRIEDVEGAR